jgi:spore coat polysaccharide biosynthesis protein SpsF (cytidylyltransferase family)
VAGALVVVEARSSMGREPGIVLQHLGPTTALELLLARLAPVRSLTRSSLVVATSDRRDDDPIVELAERRGLRVVRGPDADPLELLVQALVRHDPDAVVHVEATGPLGDPFVVAAAIARQADTGADVVTNRLPRSYPHGLEVSVVGARALRAAALEATDPLDRARPARLLVRHPERFRLANLDSGHDASAERWRLEDRLDLDALTRMLAQVPDPIGTGWDRLLAIVGRRVRPRPGEPVLHAAPGPPPGSRPWRREWAVLVDGRPVGSVGVEAADRRSTRSVTVPDELREATLAALYRVLVDDDQVGT